MRRTAVLACILSLTLLLVPLAAAAKDSNPGAQKREERAADHGHDGAAHAPPFVAAFRALRASWHENATSIRESCHAVEKDGNATQEDRLERAHCIRDGYKAWMSAYRVERREMRAHMADRA